MPAVFLVDVGAVLKEVGKTNLATAFGNVVCLRNRTTDAVVIVEKFLEHFFACVPIGWVLCGDDRHLRELLQCARYEVPNSSNVFGDWVDSSLKFLV